MKKLFFRNDDIRDNLDDSLISLTELFVELQIPIIHAVEPANVSKQVVEWLITKKMKYPALIEIIQHGYNHKKISDTQKGEFGFLRGLEDQFNDIQEGKYLMNEYFSNNWFECFSFPYGTYNLDTLKAIEKLSYKAITTSRKNDFLRTIFNEIGKIGKKKILFNKKIIYDYQFIPNVNLLEIPIHINTTKKQLDINSAENKSARELKNEFENCKKKEVIGVLLHHRWLKQIDIEELRLFLLELKKTDHKFFTLQELYYEKMDYMFRPRLV